MNQGHDVVCGRYGRVEVKCRQLPPDGRTEERVAISPSKKSGFDFLAVVVFHTDFTVKGAVIVPYSGIWKVAAHQEYNRVSYSQALRLAGAIDVTALVRKAASE